MSAELKNAPPKFRSPVWGYFGFRIGGDESKSTCKLCFVDVSYKAGNTSNMRTHLHRHHSITIDDRSACSPSRKENTDHTVETVKLKSACSGQLRINDVLKPSSKLGFSHPRAKSLTNAIGYFIACDMRPYSVVENFGFKHLLKIAEPRYNIPSRPHFSETVIPGFYRKVKTRLQTELNEVQSVAITTDSWTSRAVESYDTVTAHFVDKNWHAKNATLQTRLLSVSHTSEHLAQVLLDCVKEWNLNKMNTKGFGPAVTTDNASNIVKAVHEAKLSPHIGCFAHTVNLAVQRGLKISQLDRLLGRIRRIVPFFHKSTTAMCLLRTMQKKLELSEEKLLIDVATRWNSTHDMVCRYLEQQPAIFSTLMSKEVKQNMKDIVTLSNDDVKAAEEIVDLLQPFKTVTKVMCDATHPTVSLIHPMKEQLLAHLQVKDSDSSMVRDVKTAMATDLRPRYSEASTLEFLLLCSAIDPRFKSLPYVDPARREDIYDLLLTKTISMQDQQVRVKMENTTENPEEHLADISQPSTSSDPALPSLPEKDDSSDSPTKTCAKKPKCALDDLFGEVFVVKIEPGKNINERLELEIKNYRSEPLQPLYLCPLDWWKVGQDKYPLLANFARYILAMPATSVASERVFSTAGDIVTAQRAALSSENVDMLMFLLF